MHARARSLGPPGPSNILVLPRGGVRFPRRAVDGKANTSSWLSSIHPSIHVSDTIDLIVGLYVLMCTSWGLFIHWKTLSHESPRECLLC